MFEITAEDKEQDSENYSSLEECLIKGERLGIVTDTLPFKIANFRDSNTFMCFLKEEKVGSGKQKKKITVVVGI